MDLVTPRGFQSQIQRIGHVSCPHIGAELPRDDVAAVIVEDRAEIEPTPPKDLDIGKIGLPELVDRCDFAYELTGNLDDDEGRACDKIMCFQYSIRRSL